MYLLPSMQDFPHERVKCTFNSRDVQRAAHNYLLTSQAMACLTVTLLIRRYGLQNSNIRGISM